MQIHKKIFIMTGEASGDMHGAMLVNALKAINGDLEFSGVGGDRLRLEGVRLLYECGQFASMGLIEPLLKLRFYKKALDNIQKFIQSNGIRTVILIDFPGFNLRLAGRLKKQGVKIIYYISPQIWAWNYSRIKKIKSFVDSMIVFYPFEKKLYESEGVKAYFAGNPLVDIVNERLRKSPELRLKTKRPCICLLPGSRLSEIKRHVPVMLDAAYLLQQKYNASFLMPVLKNESSKFIDKAVSQYQHKLNINIIYDNTYRAIQKSDFLIISSGTATLEAAILSRPMVIIYKLDYLSYFAGRLLVRIKNIGLVNIVAGKTICPELIQREASSERIFSEVCRYLDDRKSYNEMISELNKVRSMLGKTGAVKRIAKIVSSII